MARTPPFDFVDREPRSLSTAGVPLTDPVLVEWFGGASVTATGMSVTAENARKCPEVDACVGLIEDTVATVPLQLFKRTGPDSREPAYDDPLYRLLHDEPNGWQSSAEFRQMMEGWRQTDGNAYARIISDGRGPVALEPAHYSEMQPFRTNTGVAYKWSPPDAASRVLLQHEVLHLKDGPAARANLARAQGKVERHREDIGLVMACSEYLGRFFSNNATPKIAIEVPGSLTPESRNELMTRWERRHRGVENQHRPAITEGGMKISPIGMTNDDAKVIETHGVGVAKIARSWGVPLHLIGETTASTSWGTGIEQQSIGFVSYYLRPDFVVWEQALARTLMSAEKRRSYFFEFNIDGLLRGDFKTRMEGYALMIQWGLASPNEIRRLMNLPPVEGGDDRLIPLNMAPASRIMDVLLKSSSSTGQKDAADEVTRQLVTLLQSSGAFDKGPETTINGH